MMTIEADTNQHLSESKRTFHDPVLIKYLLPTDTQGTTLTYFKLNTVNICFEY